MTNIGFVYILGKFLFIMVAERLNDINQDPYAIYDIGKFLRTVILQDAKKDKEERLQGKTMRDEVLSICWGEGAKSAFYISPSTAANCLKWVGYDVLGYKGVPRKYEHEM